MNAVEIVSLDPADVTALWCHYPGQTVQQGCFIALNLETGRFWADYDPEVGGGIPESVWSGRTLHWTIPCLTASAANKLLAELEPLAAVVLKGASIDWDGHNHVGSLSQNARKAHDEITEKCDLDDIGHPDVIAECDAADWFTYADDPSIVAEYGITAKSTDGELVAAANKADKEALAIGEPGPVVINGTLDYFESLRENLQEPA